MEYHNVRSVCSRILGSADVPVKLREHDIQSQMLGMILIVEIHRHQMLVVRCQMTIQAKSCPPVKRRIDGFLHETDRVTYTHICD